MTVVLIRPAITVHLLAWPTTVQRPSRLEDDEREPVTLPQPGNDSSGGGDGKDNSPVVSDSTGDGDADTLDGCNGIDDGPPIVPTPPNSVDLVGGGDPHFRT